MGQIVEQHVALVHKVVRGVACGHDFRDFKVQACDFVQDTVYFLDAFTDLVVEIAADIAQILVDVINDIHNVLCHGDNLLARGRVVRI